MSDELLNALHSHHLERNSYDGALEAYRFMGMRETLRHWCVNFNSAQEYAKKSIRPRPLVVDGKVQTLTHALSPRTGDFAWPATASRILQGLQLRQGRPFHAADGDNYYCPLTFGPPQQRQYGKYICLFAYVESWNTGHIVWIGREAELTKGEIFLRRMTRNFTDLAAF